MTANSRAWDVLAVDKKGVLTGTTELGGTLSDGTAFQLTPPKRHQTAWTETVLHNFGAALDAVGPFTGLARGFGRHVLRPAPAGARTGSARSIR